MTTGTAENVNKSCVQGTMDTSPRGHFGPQHSVLTTYNRELSEAGTWPHVNCTGFKNSGH